MIQTELLNGGTLIRHYSDSGMMILQTETGMLYEDAADVLPCRFTYEETDVPLTEGYDLPAEEALAELLAALE